MWKLTITQKRNSEYSDRTISESVEYRHNSIKTLTTLIDNLNSYESGIETTYKLEKVGE